MGFVFVWGKATDTAVGRGVFLSAKLANISWRVGLVVFQACNDFVKFVAIFTVGNISF